MTAHSVLCHSLSAFEQISSSPFILYLLLHFPSFCQSICLLTQQNAMPFFFLLQHPHCPAHRFVITPRFLSFWTLKLISNWVSCSYFCAVCSPNHIPEVFFFLGGCFYFNRSRSSVLLFLVGDAGGQRWRHGGQAQLWRIQDHPPVQHSAPKEWGRGTKKKKSICF